jgi:large subunit ribosomal protein L23
MNYDILKGLIYTEKSNKDLAEGKYYFKIDKDCTKSKLKNLIKSFFNVDVLKVNVSNVTGKTKRFKGIIGQRKSYKKAIVTLKEGQSINFQNLK